MDAVILAGGLGSRLTGIWGGPKCLVPLGDRGPLLGCLLGRIRTELPVSEGTVTLALGYGAYQVMTWYERYRRTDDAAEGFDVRYSVEPTPLGTLRALGQALAASRGPVAVLNGDTWPQYSLTALLTEARGDVAAWAKNTYAGACIMSHGTKDLVLSYARSGSHMSLDRLIRDLVPNRIQVDAFLDVGTPEGFAAAAHFTSAEG